MQDSYTKKKHLLDNDRKSRNDQINTWWKAKVIQIKGNGGRIGGYSERNWLSIYQNIVRYAKNEFDQLDRLLQNWYTYELRICMKPVSGNKDTSVKVMEQAEYKKVEIWMQNQLKMFTKTTCEHKVQTVTASLNKQYEIQM